MCVLIMCMRQTFKARGRPGMIHHVRVYRTVVGHGMCVSRGVDAMQVWHIICRYISGFLDSPFLAVCGGEEQDDGLLG